MSFVKKMFSILLSSVILLTSLFALSTTAFAASSFTAWSVNSNSFPTSDSSSNYKYYYSNINDYVKSGYGLPNCTCYAYGRAYEVLKTKPNLPNSNASDWYNYNIENGCYSYGNVPLAGAIACWSGGSTGSGHVAFVESVNGDTLTLSESAYSWRYSDKDYDMHVFEIKDYQLNSWYGTNYVFQGFIYLFESAAVNVQDLWKLNYSINVRDGYSLSANVISRYNKGGTISVMQYKSKDGYLWGRVGENAWCCLDYGNYVSGTNNSGYYGLTYNLQGGVNNNADYMLGAIKKKGTAITISKDKPVKEGYNFLGWSTSEKSASVKYQPGDTYNKNKSVTLYAVWQRILDIDTSDIKLDYYGEGSAALQYEINTDKPYRIVYSRSDKTVASCNFSTKSNVLIISALKSGNCTVTVKILNKNTDEVLDSRSINVTVKKNQVVTSTNSIYKNVTVSDISENSAKINFTLKKTYSITEYGVYYGTQTDNMKSLSSEKSTEKSDISLTWNSGLKKATWYYVKAYFVYNGKTYTSPIQKFITSGTWSVSNISIYKQPKTDYIIGDQIDDAGMILKVTYANSSTRYKNSGWTTSGFDTQLAGAKEVTVKYGKKGIAKYNIQVNCPTPSKPVIACVNNTISGVKLKWDSLSNANKYRVYRKAKGDSSWTKLTDTTKTYYTDKTAKLNTLYYYAVKGCYSSNGQSKWGSLSKSVGILRNNYPALTISKLTYNSLSLEWDKIADATGYEIYVTTDGEEYNRIYSVKGASNIGYIHTGLTAGKEYGYKSRYFKIKDGKKTYGPYSNVVKIKPTPVTVLDFTATSIAYDKLSLSWEKQAGVTGYVVYRSDDGETYSNIYSVKGASKTGYTDFDLVAGKTYYYKIRAYKSVSGNKVYGDWSEVISAKPKPNAVIGLTAENNKNNRAIVSWDKQAGVTGYVLYRSTDKKNYTKVYSVKGASKTGYIDTDLTTGNTYYYKIRAYKSANGSNVYGSYSSAVSVKIIK